MRPTLIPTLITAIALTPDVREALTEAGLEDLIEGRCAAFMLSKTAADSLVVARAIKGGDLAPVSEQNPQRVSPIVSKSAKIPVLRDSGERLDYSVRIDVAHTLPKDEVSPPSLVNLDV